MHVDVWYDLVVRELSELTDAATEILKEAEAIAGPTLTDDDPEETAPAA